MKKTRVSMRVFLVACLLMGAVGVPLSWNICVVWPEERKQEEALGRARNGLQRELLQAREDVRTEQLRLSELEKARSQFQNAEEAIAFEIEEFKKLLTPMPGLEELENRVKELESRLVELKTG